MPSDEEYERLGAALSERLRAVRTPIEPTMAFQARLDREFAAVRAGRAATRRRRWAFSVSLPVLSAAAAAVVLFVVSGPEPAFAVTRGTNGTVTITLNDIAGVSGANTKLRDLGVNDVVVVPITTDCTTRVAMSYIGIRSPGASTVTVTPGDAPTGTTIVLAAEQTSQGQIEEAIGRVSGPAPTCVAPASASAAGASTGPVATTATAAGSS